MAFMLTPKQNLLETLKKTENRNVSVIPLPCFGESPEIPALS